jgi:hypothetical protein
MVALKLIGQYKIIQLNTEITKFFTELELGGFEDLCSCISRNFIDHAKGDGKVERFFSNT